ncbi:flagellin [Vibrio diazotrophicus]|uniref:flagellin n=1 Tax=Vibrio diazotrophicus TaxID=685 RepID=UPI000C9E0C7F|nr:flagellin [Vibrio diazotrophicus]PNH91949.1 flagellin [Vibrio diazotrophicus]
MTINVNTNVSAMTAQRYLNKASGDLNTSMERLSSGNRINSAKDDAAGLQISNRLTAQSRGLDVAMRNANDGISIAQTAEGAMNESTSILQRMRDLSLQSANGTNSLSERKALNEEVSALQDELNRIAETTSFGGRKLLNGSFGEASFQIGSSSGEAIIMGLTSIRADEPRMGGMAYVSEQGKTKDWGVPVNANELTFEFTGKDGEPKTVSVQAKVGDDIEELATYINGQTDVFKASVDEDGKLQIFIAEPDMAQDFNIGGSLAGELGLSTESGRYTTVQDIDVTTVGGSQNAVGIIDAALKYVDSQRADLGAKQNRLSHSISNLANIQENVEASKSRIKDTDFAKETTQLTKSQILQQAGTSILAQAKQLPNSAITLLQ